MRSKKEAIDYKVFWALLAVTSVILYFVLTAVSSNVGIVLMYALLVTFVWQLMEKVQRNIERHQDNLFKQNECLEQLKANISPKKPLPYTRGYRGSPDFLLEIYHCIIENQPRNIVEASSGLSTLVSAYALEKIGDKSAHVYSMEHEQNYADISSSLVSEHDLGSRATVFHAPLINHTINNKHCQWYDFNSASLPEEIDLIIVDGPPRRTQENARYPALPLLFERLKKGGIILLDDANRPAEIATVKRWKEEYPDMTFEKIPLEKGMVKVTK